MPLCRGNIHSGSIATSTNGSFKYFSKDISSFSGFDQPMFRSRKSSSPFFLQKSTYCWMVSAETWWL